MKSPVSNWIPLLFWARVAPVGRIKPQKKNTDGRLRNASLLDWFSPVLNLGPKIHAGESQAFGFQQNKGDEITKLYMYLVPLGERFPSIFYVVIWNHPVETTLKNLVVWSSRCISKNKSNKYIQRFSCQFRIPSAHKSLFQHSDPTEMDHFSGSKHGMKEQKLDHLYWGFWKKTTL